MKRILSLLLILHFSFNLFSKPKQIKWSVNYDYSLYGTAEGDRFVIGSNIYFNKGVFSNSAIKGKYYEQDGKSYIMVFDCGMSADSISIGIYNDKSGLLIADKTHKSFIPNTYVKDVYISGISTNKDYFEVTKNEESYTFTCDEDLKEHLSIENSKWSSGVITLLSSTVPKESIMELYSKYFFRFPTSDIDFRKDVGQMIFTSSNVQLKYNTGHNYVGSLVYSYMHGFGAGTGILKLKTGEVIHITEGGVSEIEFVDGTKENKSWWSDNYTFDSQKIPSNITYTQYHAEVLKQNEVANKKKATDEYYHKKLWATNLTAYQKELYRIGLKYCSLILYKREGQMKVSDENKVKEKCHTEKEFRKFMKNLLYIAERDWSANEYRTLYNNLDSEMQNARRLRTSFEIQAANAGY